MRRPGVPRLILTLAPAATLWGAGVAAAVTLAITDTKSDSVSVIAVKTT
jgi:hypothetical protein